MTQAQQNRFAMLAGTALSAGRSKQNRLEALRSVTLAAESEFEKSGAEAARLACGPGCSACCAINVTLLEPEALAISDFIDTRFAPAERTRLVEKLQILHRETRWLDDEERIMTRKRCAFLDQRNECSIHPVRPLLCRSVSSTDSGQCSEALAMLALGEPPMIICNLEQKHLYEQAFLGLAEALREHLLDDRGYRLTGKVLELLSHEKGRP